MQIRRAAQPEAGGMTERGRRNFALCNRNRWRNFAPTSSSAPCVPCRMALERATGIGGPESGGMTERGGANLKDDHLAFCDNACQPEG